jgi:hypothetical protein
MCFIVCVGITCRLVYADGGCTRGLYVRQLIVSSVLHLALCLCAGPSSPHPVWGFAAPDVAGYVQLLQFLCDEELKRLVTWVDPVGTSGHPAPVPSSVSGLVWCETTSATAAKGVLPGSTNWAMALDPVPGKPPLAAMQCNQKLCPNLGAWWLV